MDEQERALRDAIPGDVRSFEVDPDKVPRVGLRMIMVILPRSSPDQPLLTSFLESEHGPWEVIRVEPSQATPGQVKVYLGVP